LASGLEGKKMAGMWSTTTNKPSLDVPSLTKPAPSYLDGGQA
jgi:hypothetical protein